MRIDLLDDGQEGVGESLRVRVARQLAATWRNLVENHDQLRDLGVAGDDLLLQRGNFIKGFLDRGRLERVLELRRDAVELVLLALETRDGIFEEVAVREVVTELALVLLLLPPRVAERVALFFLISRRIRRTEWVLRALQMCGSAILNIARVVGWLLTAWPDVPFCLWSPFGFSSS